MLSTQSKRKSELVTQANALVEASYKLTLEEKRLIIGAITKINPKKEVPKSITITAEYYADTFDLDINSAYQQLKDACNRLYERTIDLSSASRQKDGKVEKDDMRWVYRRKLYERGQGKATIYFSPDLMPYLGELQKSFTSYKLESVKHLKRFYSIRLYELCMQYMDFGSRWITIESFREMFCLEDKYNKFAELRRNVIDPAINEINDNTDINITYNLEKKGNKVVKIWFNFSEKKQKQFGF